MKVWVNGTSRGRKIDRSALRRIATTTCVVSGFPDSELSLTLVGDAAMAELAGRFGRAERPTDVLAFSLLEGPGAQHRGDCLGDVVISVDTAARQAREHARPLADELRDLLIHGVLHLLGLDHEQPGDRRRMRELEDRVRAELCGLRRAAP